MTVVGSDCMFDIFDGIDDEIAYYEKKNGKRSHRRTYPERSVKYVSAGHTRVTYKNRILDIHFKQSDKEFAQAQKRRRNAVTRQKNARTSYDTIQRHKDLRNDRYSLEDMRSMMKDDHWEEVCHHKRWNYDSNSTVKEFKKYLSHSRRVR